MNLLQPRLDGHSQCHLSWAQNNQGVGDLGRGIRGLCGKQGEDLKGEGLLSAFQGPRQDATPTSFSFFTAYTVFLSTARYTHPKPPSPIFSSSEKLWVPWEISWRGQQNGEGWFPCSKDNGFSGLCCGKRPQSGDVLSPPLSPRHKLPRTPAASQLDWLGLPGVPKPGFLVPCLEPFRGTHLPW